MKEGINIYYQKGFFSPSGFCCEDLNLNKIYYNNASYTHCINISINARVTNTDYKLLKKIKI